MNDAVQTDELEEEFVITEEPTEELDLGQETEEESSEEVEAVEEAEEVEDEPKQSRNQNAKQRLRRKNRELEAEVARLKQQDEEIAALKAQVDSVINPPEVRPNRVDFDTEEDYEDKLYEWRNTSNQKPVEVQKQATTHTQAEQELGLDVSKEVHDNWMNQMDDMSDKYDDFEDIVASIPSASMTKSMTISIMESRQAGEIANFLGRNHGEASRIARLGLTAQVLEISKLGAKFKKTTAAPDPVKTVNHGGDSSNNEKEDPAFAGMKFE